MASELGRGRTCQRESEIGVHRGRAALPITLQSLGPAGLLERMAFERSQVSRDAFKRRRVDDRSGAHLLTQAGGGRSRVAALSHTGFLLAATICLGACSAPLDLGFAIAVTVRFDDAIPASARASTIAFLVTSSGDEHADYTETLPQGAAVVERFVYRPDNATRSIELSVRARDATATLATGSTGLLALSAGRTTEVEVLLTDPRRDADLGLRDLGGGADGDGATLDGGDGDGGFGPVSTLAFQHADRYTGCAGASETALADFDSDGRVDIAVTCTSASSVQVFFGKVDGSFPSSPSSITTVFSAGSLVALDFDADAKIDLVVVNGDGAHLLKNDGTGHFSDLATRSLGGAPAVRTADFDKDGILDLVTDGSFGGIRVLWGSAVAATAFSSSLVVALTNYPASTSVVDLDGDAYPDVFVLEHDAARHVSIRNTHAASARTFAAASFATLPWYPSSILFQDANNDGKPEAILSGGTGGGYGFNLLTNTNGVLAWGNPFPLYPRNGGALDMALVDIDHDGLADLVLSAGIYVTTYKCLGPLQFETSSGGSYWAGGNTGHIHAANFDKDGFEDLVLVDGDGFSVVRGGASAKLSGAEAFAFSRTDNIGPMLASDFDKDGDADVVALDWYTSEAYVVTNNGAGKLTTSPPFASPVSGCGNLSAIAVGDVDNDGHPDILRLHQRCYDVVRSTGGGLLTQGPVAPAISGAIELFAAALADLDGDGKLDLVLIDKQGSLLMMSHGLGDGSFAAASNASVFGPARLLLVDVNKDGHVDIIVGGVDAKISTFLNDGLGGFGAPTQVTGPTGFTEIAVGDFDEDQIVDLVAVGNSIYQFKGGPGYSDAQRSTRTLLAAWTSVRVADFDRDGHLDQLGRTATGFEIWRGAGNGSYTPAHSFNFPAGNGELLVRDLDGDQLPEILLTNAVNPGNGAVVLRNLSR